MSSLEHSKRVGVAGALVMSLLMAALLILVSFVVPAKHQEEGVPVVMGNVEEAMGEIDPASMTEVKVTSQEDPVVSEQEAPADEPLITQEEEKTVALAGTNKKKKIQPDIQKAVAPTVKKVASQATTAEKQRQAQLKEQQTRRAEAEATSRRVAGAFGKGQAMSGGRGTSDKGSGQEGSRNGNSSYGARKGNGGYGTFSLDGRSVRGGSLPAPTYNVQEEGRVVVSITVAPSGQVVAATINRRTNTVNASLRRAALEAARKARFNIVEESNNQSGSITYYFKLK